MENGNEKSRIYQTVIREYTKGLICILREKDKYINRELNWLEFNNRVLEEAADNKNPLFERLKFMSIVNSNLDEFFMIRVASLYDQVQAGFVKKDVTGLTPVQQFEKSNERIHKMVNDQYTCFRRLVKLLKTEGIQLDKGERFDGETKEYIKNFYYKNIYPVITPMVVDKSRPFPLILSRSLNIALLLENKERNEEPVFATVQVPSVLDRFIKLSMGNTQNYIVLIENIITMFLEELFDGHKILSYGYYRITRNADSGLDEEGAEDLLEAIEQFVKKRKWGSVIRLEVNEKIDDALLLILEREFEVPSKGIYKINGPIDLTFLMKLITIEGFNKLRYAEFKPQIPIYINKFNDDKKDLESNEHEKNIFEIIDKKDALIHHPFESFDFIIDMVNQAAKDPDVLAIKQTLYRVSGNSPIVKALVKAAENGKQVTVLVELKARFDEENNMLWAKQLEMAGCHVIYGLVGLKIHCKMLLIIKKQNGQLKRYVHLGTGNYNDITAKMYTDIGFLTCNPYMGADVSAIFNMLSGYSKLSNLYKTCVAPSNLRQKFISLIKQEAKNASEGKKARIIAKTNSLVDKEIIDTLYKASNDGVKIDLIVRGICCLRAQVPGLSDNITVRSIVGRFLEHSRIFYFYNDGNEQLFLSSADWMPRNLDRRVEILFPIENTGLADRLKRILQIYMDDNVKARVMNSSGMYKKIPKKQGDTLASQEYFYKELKEFKKRYKKDLRNTLKNM